MSPILLGTIGLWASAVIATVGFSGFALLARFWTSRGGWHVFWFMLVIAWVLDLTAISHLFRATLWFSYLRAGSFAIGMPLVLGWRSWIIFDLQLFRRRRQQAAQLAYAQADSRPAVAKEEADPNGDRMGS